MKERWGFGFLLPLVLVFCVTGQALAQSVSVGMSRGGFGPLLAPAPRPATVIELDNGATADGQVNVATFRWWSETPCPAAAKIKVFRPDGETMRYLEERGPFDARQNHETSFVVLSPPVSLRRGDFIGITSVSSCGEPAIDEGGRGYFIVPGDVHEDVTVPASSHNGALVNVAASHTANQLQLLLLNRFVVTVNARNPRTGRFTAGTPIAGSDRFGCFSLPDFTGDPTFPEIIVKMADATALPPPFGGSFWFFYSSLTDVEYSVRVLDTRTSGSREYASAASQPGLLCGGSDTNAFQ